MVKTTVAKVARKKKRKLRSETKNPKKKHSPSPPDPDRFYRMSDLPSWVEDPGAECLLHTTAVLRGQMERRRQERLASLTNSIPSAASATAACPTDYSTHTAAVTPASACVKQQTSPSALSATADIIPVARPYQPDIISLISPDKPNNAPSTPQRHNNRSLPQLSGSDSDDAVKTAPPHSLLPFYSVTQLRSMKVHVHHVSDLARYLISEHSIAKSVSSRVQKERADVRIELMQLLAGLKHTLHVLFS